MTTPLPKFSPGRLVAAIVLSWFTGPGAVLAEAPITPKTETRTATTSLWSVKGAKNTVYFLGSVHILRPEDYPLPAAMDAAYADSKVLVLEITSADMESPASSALTMQLGMYQDGSTLQSKLSPESYAFFKEKATAAGLPPAMLNSMKPWMAGMAVVVQQLTTAGYDLTKGVDKHFEAQALTDKKPVEALETAKFQLGVFEQLSATLGDDFMKQMLTEADAMTKMLDDMVTAWKKGDALALDTLMSKSYDGFPDIERVLLLDRNNAWVKKLEADYLKRDENVLIIVGAGHLVGKNSVITQLGKKGYAIEQL